MPRGGYYPNAERWGRKSTWSTPGQTKSIRVPESLAEQILQMAHKLDTASSIDYDTETNTGEIGALRQQVDEMRSHLIYLQQDQKQLDNLVFSLYLDKGHSEQWNGKYT